MKPLLFLFHLKIYKYILWGSRTFVNYKHFKPFKLINLFIIDTYTFVTLITLTKFHIYIYLTHTKLKSLKKINMKLFIKKYV